MLVATNGRFCWIEQVFGDNSTDRSELRALESRVKLRNDRDIVGEALASTRNVRVRIARKTPIALHRADQSLPSSTRFIVEVRYIPQHLRNAAFCCKGRFSHPGGVL